MRINTIIVVSLLTLLVGCSSTQKTDTAQTPVSGASATGSNVRIVKSKDVKIDGEVIGSPARGSKFAKLEIGMSSAAVVMLIGVPDDQISHITGKAFIPFYFGSGTAEMEYFYAHSGRLTFDNEGVSSSGYTLIRIENNQHAEGLSR